ncbi:MAG TPA: hypothetical protein VK897_09700 [Anaerolineales bacterium]|nr:hypothetical protein [Anaerolineales bacterium]
MKLAADFWQESSSAQRIIYILASLCSVGLIVLSVMGLAVRARLQEMASVVPTQECHPSTLVLGETTFQIQILPLGPDGLSNLPINTAGIAYWVDGTQTNPVFVLSPTPKNLAVVSTIDLGSQATATWADCTVVRYPVTAHEPGAFGIAVQQGITVFFPIDASGAGFVFTAALTGEPDHVLNRPTPAIQNTQSAHVTNTISPSPENTLPPSPAIANAPFVESTMEPVATDSVSSSVEDLSSVPEEDIILPAEEDAPVDSNRSDVLAEIGLLEVISSEDGENVMLNVSIYNYGGSAFIVSENSISLTQPDGTELVMIESEPFLPKEIAATETETFTFTFPHPSSSIATLKIFTVEYDVEDY